MKMFRKTLRVSLIEPSVENRCSDHPDSETGEAPDYLNSTLALLDEHEHDNRVCHAAQGKAHHPAGLPEVSAVSEFLVEVTPLADLLGPRGEHLEHEEDSEEDEHGPCGRRVKSLDAQPMGTMRP